MGSVNGSAASFTGLLGGDVNGSQGATTVVGLRGSTIASVAPADQQVLKYVSATGQWTPAPDNSATYTASSGVLLAANNFSANFTVAGGDDGTATTVARGDHIHDTRYYTQAFLSSAGTVNLGTNPVDWTRLKNVPPGFADGVDDNSGGTVTSVTAGGGLSGGVITGAARSRSPAAACSTPCSRTRR